MNNTASKTTTKAAAKAAPRTGKPKTSYKCPDCGLGGSSRHHAPGCTHRMDRGFRRMNPQQRKELAAKGGKAAHERGMGHEWTRREASAAGRLGGLKSAAVKRDRAAASAVVPVVPIRTVPANDSAEPSVVQTPGLKSARKR